MNSQELSIVVLEHPYDIWDIAPTQELFGKMVSLKLAGYRARHPYGVMPVEAYDYIGIHQLVCRKAPSGWVPLMGYKMVSYERCRMHKMPFPMLPVFGGAHPRHDQATRQIIERCERENISLAYPASWTIAPQLRSDRRLIQDLRSIFEAMYVFCCQHYDFREIVCGCVPRVKTDVLFAEWGHERVSAGGQLLPPVKVPHLQDDEIVLMHLRQFNPAVLARAERWRGLWDNRVEIKRVEASVIPLKKAA